MSQVLDIKQSSTHNNQNLFLGAIMKNLIVALSILPIIAFGGEVDLKKVFSSGQEQKSQEAIMERFC